MIHISATTLQFEWAELYDAVRWDVGGDFLRFCQRSDPIIIIIELFRGWVLFLLQEHQLRVEEETELFQQVSCRPLDCENVETSKQTPPQMFLSFACGAQSTHGRDAIPVLLRPLFSHRASRCLYLPPLPAPRAASVRSALVGWVPEPRVRRLL